jgi:hypothetical protein
MSEVRPSERPVPEALRWYYYIHLCGDEGREWVREYERVKGWDMGFRLDRVMWLCRRRRADEAQALLTGCLTDLRAAEGTATPSVVSVMRRWYLSSEAYYFYFCRDLGRARRLLEESEAAIRTAIAQSRFLVGVATGCVEFAVHYARLARDQRQWGEMRHWIATARAMYRNEAPLCSLADGSQIFLHTIYGLISSLTPTNEKERESLAFLLNPGTISTGIEVLIRRIEAFPNVVVPFT